MTPSQKDTARAQAAAKAILDGRHPRSANTNHAEIMVTLEHTVAVIMLALYPDHRIAAGMLTEALVPGVEARLAYGAQRTQG